MTQEELKSFVLLIKLDANNLIKRLEDNHQDALLEFSLKRTREHFKDLFFSRYKDIKIDDLKSLDSNLLVLLNRFYSKIDELSWYLNHTQDMTTRVDDFYEGALRSLKKNYNILDLHLNAALGVLEKKDETNSDLLSSDSSVYT